MTAVLDLFIAATIPVMNVLLTTALGLYLALDHVNIMGDETRKHMNNVVFYVFNPALVASNLAQTITYESMVKLWFMPFNVLLTFVIGSILGWIVIQLTRPPSHLRGLILASCAAGNMGNMLLIIIPAVCKEKGSPFGSPDVCQSLGMGYVSLSMALGAIYLWSYVFNIVRMYSTTSINDSTTEPLLSKDLLPPPHHKENQFLLPCTSCKDKAEATLSSKIKHNFNLLIAKMNLKALFAPSTTGVIVGFVIGLVPQIRKLLIGDNAPLRAIQDSTYIVGNGAIPTLTLIMGGNLLKGLRGSGVQKSIILGIIVARYIALPLIGVVIVKGASYIGFVHDDPLFQFILLLQFAVPPAMNIGTIVQLFGTGESECSVIMLWTYALASVSLTLWSTFFMWLVA
ncbi:Auxin efflux carrier [Corchorus capsularis]|uniref:Auxin efflux carrier n=1 Tax=Corchorus capsularis TaxID=210143 RepID=A0A1R3JGE4_COCAP|nr:Auxin efflux carrier [Corchorus capsularis]